MPASKPDSLLECRVDLRVRLRRKEEPALHSDHESFHTLAEPVCVVGNGLGRGRRVIALAARDRAKKKCAIADGARERADGVHRRAHRDDSATADAAECRLEPDHAVHRSGRSYRPAGVGADGSERCADCDRDARACARAARVTGDVPCVAGRRHVLAIGELVCHGLADEDGTRLPKPRHDRGVGVGNEAGEHGGPGLSREPSRVAQVLDADRDAVQRPARLACPQLFLGSTRLLACRLGHQTGIGVDDRLRLFDQRQRRVQQLGR